MKERMIADFSAEVASVSQAGRMLTGYASVFNYPINSGVKSHPQTTFVKPGAFTRTLKNNRDQIQVLFNHGQDRRYGELPIGTVQKLEENSRGLWAEVELHDGPDNENIRAALASGALRSMSIQFEVIQESYNTDRSERYLNELKLWEFGPVTFPANAAATASLHSLSDLVATEMEWDGPAAMRTCDTAAEFRQIAFELANDSDPDTQAHWALPHHPRPGAGPDSGGVSAALGRLNQTGQTVMSKESIRSHLERHQSESSSAEPRDSTLDQARLTWLEKARVRVGEHAEETERLEARWQALGS